MSLVWEKYLVVWRLLMLKYGLKQWFPARNPSLPALTSRHEIQLIYMFYEHTMTRSVEMLICYTWRKHLSVKCQHLNPGDVAGVATFQHQKVGFSLCEVHSLTRDDCAVGCSSAAAGGGRAREPVLADTWGHFDLWNTLSLGEGFFNQRTCMGIPWHATRTKHTQTHTHTHVRAQRNMRKCTNARK